MNRHGKSRAGIVTVSCKIEESYAKALDDIAKKQFNQNNRSEILRKAIYKYVNSYKQR